MKSTAVIYSEPFEFHHGDLENAGNVKSFLLERGYLIRESLRDLPISTPGDLSSVVDLLARESVSAFAVYSLKDMFWVGTSTQIFLRFIAELARNGIRFFSVGDRLDSDQASAEFILLMESAISKAKSSVKAKKIQRSLILAKQNGVHIGRPKKTDDEKVKTLREMGRSLIEISQELEVSIGAIQYSLRQPDRPKV